MGDTKHFDLPSGEPMLAERQRHEPETYGPAIRVELLGQGSTDATIRAANHHYPTCWINHYQPRHLVRSRRSFANKLQRVVVGQAGFEPTTSSSRTKRATNLRHCPLSRSGTSDASAYVT